MEEDQEETHGKNESIEAPVPRPDLGANPPPGDKKQVEFRDFSKGTHTLCSLSSEAHPFPKEMNSKGRVSYDQSKGHSLWTV